MKHKSLKTWLGLGLLAGSLYATEPTTNSPLLSISDDASQVSVNPTSPERVYRVLENTDLTSTNWYEQTRCPGNESNLVFAVNNSTSKFIKVKSIERIDPTFIETSYTKQPTGGNPPINRDYYCANNDLNLTRALVTWTETMNPYGVTYTIDLPRIVTLNPGDNNIPTSFQFTSGGYGATVWGKIDILREVEK